MKNKEVRKLLDQNEAICFLLAVGGNGVKGAVAFILSCMSSRVNLGTVYIYIHDADRENGDCNQLRMAAENYKTAHVMGNGKVAATEIILAKENLADCMENRNLNAMISNRDPRKDIMNGSTDQIDRAMNLLDGQYGRADIGAFNNIARSSVYRNSGLMKRILKYLGDGKQVAVISVGGCSGGTGASYTVDDVMQIMDAAIGCRAEKNLHTAAALLGPCTSNPKPTEQQLEEYGREYDVDSNEAFARTAAAFRHMNKIRHLLPNDADEEGHYYLDRMYYAGNPRLDPGAAVWQIHHQDVHPTHLLHWVLGAFIFDFFLNYHRKPAENDTGVRLFRFHDGNESVTDFGWENLPAAQKTEIVSAMRFCVIFRTEIVPLFALPIDDLKNNRVTKKWFASGRGNKLCLDQNLLDKIIGNVERLSGICTDYIRCFCDIQSSTELGTGRKLVKLFDQKMLEGILKTDYKAINSFTINQNSYCVPDLLTRESWPNLDTGLTGTAIMDALAENRRLCADLKDSCHNPDDGNAAAKITESIVEAVYQLAAVN